MNLMKHYPEEYFGEETEMAVLVIGKVTFWELSPYQFTSCHPSPSPWQLILSQPLYPFLPSLAFSSPLFSSALLSPILFPLLIPSPRIVPICINKDRFPFIAPLFSIYLLSAFAAIVYVLCYFLHHPFPHQPTAIPLEPYFFLLLQNAKHDFRPCLT